MLQCGADALEEDPLSRLSLSNNAHWGVVRALMGEAPRFIVLGGGGYNPWSVGRCWAGVWGTLNGFAVPERLPPAAEAVLRNLSWDRSAGRRPPEHWFTTLRDPPRPGVVRAEVQRLAVGALRDLPTPGVNPREGPAPPRANASGASCGRLCPASGMTRRSYRPEKYRACRSDAASGPTPSPAAVQGDGRHGDARLRREPRLDPRQRRIAGHQPEAVAVGMDHHLDEIRVVEGRRALRSKVASSKAQFGDHSRHSSRHERAPVCRQPGAAALAVEVVLVPEPVLVAPASSGRTRAAMSWML